MVRCTDGTYYTGSTNNLEARIKLHNAGNGAKYLRGKGPVKLVYAKQYRYYKLALQAEARLKKLTRGEKEVLVEQYRNVGPTDFSVSWPPIFLALAGSKSRLGATHTFGDSNE